MTSTRTAERMAERIESLKAGLIAAITSGATYLLASGLIAWTIPDLQGGWQGSHRPILALPIALPDGLPVILIAQVAIAFLTGFLFGVTYRYAVRQDTNPQLKAGTVMAFGLVRGLAQIEVDLTVQPVLAEMVMNLAMSLLIISLACFALEIAFRWGWVKPCGTAS